MASTVSVNVSYSREQEMLSRFIDKFVPTPDSDDIEAIKRMQQQQQVPKYRSQLQNIADRKQNSLVVELDDVRKFEEEGEALARRMQGNTKRYIELLYNAVDVLIHFIPRSLLTDNDVIDVILDQRTARDEVHEETNGSSTDMYPPSLKRRYTVYIKPLSSQKPIAVRGIGSDDIGSLVKLSGMVTRVSDVKPLLVVNAYSCDQCGCEVFQEVKSRTLKPLDECPSRICQQNKSKGRLYMQTRASKFLRYQELRVQELTDQVPMGHIPRTMTVHLYEGLTRTVNTGDIAHIGGIFLPTPYTGYRAIRAGLIADTYLEAQHIEVLKKTYDKMDVSADVTRQIERLSSDANLYHKLTQSISPEIYGHEDVKKALLLLLVGGVTKEVGDGMKIRGDINVCLMGDPGVAKSQLLKWVSKTAPRGIYTTGKGSSGVGLTAAVMKDPVTGEMVLEGGALVLADNGICCIDEFDKMDDGDKTAIHEVMEQQTISISKAGIVTTLNARTSILAAANPVYGRYNTSLTAIQNINLPAALLSRFDMLFLMLDNPSMDDDIRLAQHVTYVHMHNKHPEQDVELLDGDMIRNYIARARTYRPMVPAEVADYVTGIYVDMRKDESSTNASALADVSNRGRRKPPKDEECGYTTARTLVSILRISQALARLRFSGAVEIGDVDEAVRLIQVSKYSLMESKDTKGDHNPITKVFSIMKSMALSDGGGNGGDGTSYYAEINVTDLRQRVIAKGLTEVQLNATIAEYAELGVLMINKERTKIRWMQSDR